MHETLLERELGEAPELIARQRTANASAVARVADALRRKPPSFVMTAARGSSDHAASFGKYLIETRLGVPVASAALSVASVYEKRLKLSGALFVAISQSGRSTDLLDTTKLARDGGARVLAVVNDEGSPLAELADDVLPIAAGIEQSIAATKSYLCSLTALSALVAEWSEDAALGAALGRLPERLGRSLALNWSAAVGFLSELGGLLLLGRGFGYAIALEAALKLEETCQMQAKPFSSAELMHGPLALARPGLPVLALNPPDVTSRGVSEVVGTLRSKRARVLVAEPGPASPERLPLLGADHPVTDAIAALGPFYRAAAETALARGLDPDKPENLRKITLTE